MERQDYWKNAVLAAYLRRALPPAWHREKWDVQGQRTGGFYEKAPDYHPAKATLIYRRFAHIIGQALDAIRPTK